MYSPRGALRRSSRQTLVMTVDERQNDTPNDEHDLTAADVAWDIDTILPDGETPADLFDRADALADELTSLHGRVGELDAGQLADAMHSIGELQDLMSRAGYHAMLAFSTATDDPERGAAMAAAQERSTAIGTKLIFFDLEWAAADDDHAAVVLADTRPRLLPPSPRQPPAEPPVPALGSRGNDPRREEPDRLRGLDPPVRRTHLGDHGRPSR